MWGNSICHQIHVSVVLLYLTLMSLTSEAASCRVLSQCLLQRVFW